MPHGVESESMRVCFACIRYLFMAQPYGHPQVCQGRRDLYGTFFGVNVAREAVRVFATPPGQAPPGLGELLAAFRSRESRPGNCRDNQDTSSYAGTNNEELLPIHVPSPSLLSASGDTAYPQVIQLWIVGDSTRWW
jgi:hypothetical protein